METAPQDRAGSLAPQASQTPLQAAIPARQALVTLAVLLVCLGAQKLTLPGVPSPAPSQPHAISNSLLVLGVQPLLSGFVLVELVALIIPAWRPLRTGRRAGREKLRYASLIVGMVLALGQAFFMAVALEKTASSTVGDGFRIITVLILLGATAALIALARIVDEAGLGGGFPVLMLVFALPHIAKPLGQAYSAFHHGALTASALQTEAFGLALLVGATLWFFSPYALPANEPWEHPALLSRPACGVAPLHLGAGMLTYLTLVVKMYSGQTIYPSWRSDVATLVLSISAAMGFAFLFNQPDRFSRVWRSLSPVPPECLPRIKSVMPECVLFIGLAVLVETGLVRVVGNGGVPSAIAVILVTGIIADLIREFRARTESTARLVPVWEIHQVYAVPPAMRLLQAQGFHPFAKGLRLRSLLQFFGPYAPIAILVPAAEAQAACALLETRWPALDRSTEA